MNTTIKSAIATCAVFCSAFMSSNAGAETSVFSGKNAYGYVESSNGPLFMIVQAFQSATQSKSNKTGVAGAYLYASYCSATDCWRGYGTTDNIQFAMHGSLPSNVTASGSIPVTWEDNNGALDPITENVTFTMDLSAITDQAVTSYYSNHTDYGTFTINQHFNGHYVPVTINNAAVTSPNFGTAIANYAEVGISKDHEVQITK